MQARTAIALGLFIVTLVLALFIFYGADAGPAASLAAWFALPLALGALLSHLVDSDGAMSPMGCFVWPTLVLLGLIGLVWLIADEGVVCIIMLLPIWIPAATAGWIMQRINARRRRKSETDMRQFHAVGWALLPLLLLAAEAPSPPQWQERTVVREIRIAAAPETVWPLLLSIPAIGEGEGQWNFTQDGLGVPRPEDAQLVQEPLGLVRKARWKGGVRFDERITALQPARQIGWRFEFIDDSVQRHTDRHISPDGPFLRIEQGRYDLHRNRDGSTTLRLSTTYRMRTRLAGYFAWWGERLLGDVQANILTIIADRAGPSAS